MEAKATTLGEQRVRVEFNPSNAGNVNFFKEKLKSYDFGSKK